MRRAYLLAGAVAVLVLGAGLVAFALKPRPAGNGVGISAAKVPQPKAWFNMTDGLLDSMPASMGSALRALLDNGSRLEHVPEADWRAGDDRIEEAAQREAGTSTRVFAYAGQFYELTYTIQ